MGLPVPPYEVVPLATGAAVVVGRVDGVSGAWPGPRLVERVLALVELQAGLAPGLRVRREPARRPGPGRGRAYVAHLALRYVDRVIRHGAPADVDARVSVATRWRRWAERAEARTG